MTKMSHTKGHGRPSDYLINQRSKPACSQRDILPAHIPRRAATSRSPTHPVSCVQSEGPRGAPGFEHPKPAVSPSVFSELSKPLDLTVKKNDGLSMKAEACEPEGANHDSEEPMDLSIRPKPLDLSIKTDKGPRNSVPYRRDSTDVSSHAILSQESPVAPIVIAPIENFPETLAPAPKVKRKRKRKNKSPPPESPTLKATKSPKMAILVDANGEEIYRMRGGSQPAHQEADGKQETGSCQSPVKFKSLLTGAIVTQSSPPAQTPDTPNIRSHGNQASSGKQEKRALPSQAQPDVKPCRSSIDSNHGNIRSEPQGEAGNSTGPEIFGIIKPEELAAYPADKDSANPVQNVNIPTTVEELDTQQQGEGRFNGEGSPIEKIQALVNEKQDSKKSTTGKRKPRKNKEPKSSKPEKDVTHDGRKSPCILRAPIYNGNQAKREAGDKAAAGSCKKSVIKSMLESENFMYHSMCNKGTNGFHGSNCQINDDSAEKPPVFSGSKLFSLLTGTIKAGTDSPGEAPGGETGPGHEEEEISDAGDMSRSDPASTESSVKQRSESPEPRTKSPGTKEESPLVTDASPTKSPTSYRSLLSGKVVRQGELSDGVMVVARGQVRGNSKSRYELVVDFKPEQQKTHSPVKTKPKSTSKKKPKSNKLEQICQSLWLKSKENTL